MAPTARSPVSDASFDYDVASLVPVGGFDAAKHAAEHGLKTAIIESRDGWHLRQPRLRRPRRCWRPAEKSVNWPTTATWPVSTTPHRCAERQKIADHANQLRRPFGRISPKP